MSPITRCNYTRYTPFSEIMDVKLPFTTPTDALSIDYIEGMTNSKCWKIIADEEKILAFLPRRLTALYLYTFIHSCSYLIIFFPFLLFCNLLLICLGSGSFWVEFHHSIWLTYINFSAALIAIILCTIIILDGASVIKLPQSGFNQYVELNRKHGTVTRFHKNKPLYTAPFTDFDCHLHPTGPHGKIKFYSLNLVNITFQKTKKIELCRLVVGACSSKENLHRIWNTIQWYMDVSRPLPDLPILEEHRGKDPVTAAYDNELGRKADFWASMSEEEFENYISQLEAKQEDLTPLGTPIQIQYVENHNAA